MNKQDLDRTLSYLQQLLAISSPTGCTDDAADFLMNALSELGYSPVRTRKGAVQVRLGGEGTEGLMLAAHVDTLGGMVRSVKSNGRLRVSPIGGLPAVSAVTETVVLHTRDGRDVAIFDGGEWVL